MNSGICVKCAKYEKVPLGFRECAYSDVAINYFNGVTRYICASEGEEMCVEHSWRKVFVLDEFLMIMSAASDED